MGDFNWDVPPPAGKGSAQATETSRRWMRCHTEEGRQERATGLPLRCPSARARWPPHPASVPSVLPLLAGILAAAGAPGRGPQGRRTCSICGSCLRWLSRTQLSRGWREPSGWAEPALQNPPVAVLCPGEAAGGLLPNFTSMRGTSLARASVSPYYDAAGGGCSPVPPPSRSIPGTPLPSLGPPPGPGCSAEAPRCPPPRHGPGCREPALRSLLTLIKILQHGGRKCIFSSSAAAIRLPGNGWLAGGQGLQRASAHPARGGGRRRVEPVVLVGTGLSRWDRS